MFGILDVIGLALRGAAALGLALFCGWSSMVLGTGHAALAALLGQGGEMVLAAMGALGLFAGFHCIISLSRERRRHQTGPRLDGFDPDAIIARHLAQRATLPPAPMRRTFTQPPRPTFGRRQA